MSKSLQEILGGRQMTGVIQTIRTGLPFPAQLNALLQPTNRIFGDKATYLKIVGTRENAQLTTYGSPARRITGKSMSETGITLMHSFLEQAHNPTILQALLGMNGEPLQAMAIEEVDRQTAEFKARFDNSRISSVFSTIAHGHIWIDSNNFFTFTSGGAAIDINWNVPAGNTGNVSGIFSNSWATATTDIVGNINAVKKRQAQNTGRVPRYAVHGANIPGYVLSNNEAKTMIQGNAALATQLWNSGGIPDGFCGLTWVPADVAFGLSSGGTVTEWFDGDQISFLPEISKDWWRMYEGSYPIPTSIDIKGDAVEAARSLQIVYGQFAYAVTGHNPPGVTQYAGDTYMPVLASPSDLVIADTVP